ncbi:hypothetical protein BCCH1_77920 (plasmid) [Burkholderia contaminans]|uniref:Uncharacterized protein n=1 Tax=Burkholderia contaminans TaxID=488447 RepID=A0A250LP02_9BURK|nr:hypothetical protein BCCH1_77920 [Burkholderia contaminans]
MTPISAKNAKAAISVSRPTDFETATTLARSRPGLNFREARGAVDAVTREARSRRKSLRETLANRSGGTCHVAWRETNH